MLAYLKEKKPTGPRYLNQSTYNKGLLAASCEGDALVSKIDTIFA
jgi:hypothetical protein